METGSWEFKSSRDPSVSYRAPSDGPDTLIAPAQVSNTGVTASMCARSGATCSKNRLDDPGGGGMIPPSPWAPRIGAMMSAYVI